MVSWCNRHCITNYTASLSINRKLHSSDRKKKIDLILFRIVQNRLRCPIQATFAVRETTEISGSCIPAYMYRYLFPSDMLFMSAHLFFGKIVPYFESGMRLITIFHIPLMLGYDNLIIIPNIISKANEHIKSCLSGNICAGLCIDVDDQLHPREACKQAGEWCGAFQLPSNAQTSLGDLCWRENDKVRLINGGTPSCTAAPWPQLAASLAAVR